MREELNSDGSGPDGEDPNPHQSSENPAEEPEVFESAPSAEDTVDEARSILQRARADSVDRPKPVSSSDELNLDPIRPHSAENGLPDNGVNIVNSFVNRAVFFDYFRHVANKRFPDLEPRERVQALIETERGFYRRSIWTDYCLKIITTTLVIGLATSLFIKAIFY